MVAVLKKGLIKVLQIKAWKNDEVFRKTQQKVEDCIAPKDQLTRAKVTDPILGQKY